MDDQTHAEEIAGIRALQRESAMRGKPLSFQSARAQAQAAREQGPDVKTMLEASIRNLKAELDALKESVNTMRITGREFSGQGPRGIMFVPGPDVTGGAAANDSPSMIFTGCITGTAASVKVTKAELQA